MKKQLLVLLTLPFILTACPSNKKDPHYGDLTYRYEDLKVDEEFARGGSYGGYFTEVNTDRFLCTNSEYTFTFESSYKKDTSFTVYSSDKSHVTVKMTKTKKFYLQTHSAGDSIIEIENALGELVYRKVVRVRPSLDEKDVLATVSKAEYFATIPELVGQIGNWKFAVTKEGSKYEGVVNGGDDYDANVKCSFTLEFEDYYKDQDYYCYLAKDAESTSRDTVIEAICFSRAGDLAYVYTTAKESSLLSISYNSDISYIYEKTK